MAELGTLISDAIIVSFRRGVENNSRGFVNSTLFTGSPLFKVVNSRNKETPLHIVSFYSRWTIRLAKRIIDLGADINAQNAKGETPLHLALEHGINNFEDEKLSLNTCKLLVERGADVNIRNKEGMSPVQLALFSGLLEAAEVFLLKVNNWSRKTRIERSYHVIQFLSKDGNNFNLPNSNYLTLLHFAAKNKDEESFKYVLKNDNGNISGNINAVNPDGTTLLHIVAESGTLEMTKALVKRGALFEVQDNSKATPLHFAVKNNRKEIVRYLIDSGASVNSLTSEDHTPLHFALAHKNLQIMQMLVNKGADVNEKSINGSTLLIACGNIWWKSEINKILGNDYICDKEILKFLLKNGADLEVRDTDNKTPLLKLCSRGASELVKVLLHFGADINAVSRKQRNALHYAVKGHNVEIVRLFLEMGIDPESRDKYNCTVMNYALRDDEYSSEYTQTNLVDIIDLLIEYGSNIEDYQNDYKDTALHVACTRYSEKALLHLLKLKANVNAIDFEGFTPFQQCLDFYNIGGNELHYLKIMTAQIAWMKAEKRMINKENLDLLQDEDIQNIYKECQLEINRMKVTIADSSYVTFYDFVRVDVHRLAAVARNKNLMEELEFSGYGKKFPLFKPFLKISIQYAKNRRKLMDDVVDLLKKRKKFKLPWNIIDDIFSYLSESDLRKFKRVLET